MKYDLGIWRTSHPFVSQLDRVISTCNFMLSSDSLFWSHDKFPNFPVIFSIADVCGEEEDISGLKIMQMSKGEGNILALNCPRGWRGPKIDFVCGWGLDLFWNFPINAHVVLNTEFLKKVKYIDNLSCSFMTMIKWWLMHAVAYGFGFLCFKNGVERRTVRDMSLKTIFNRCKNNHEPCTSIFLCSQSIWGRYPCYP